MSTSSRSHSPGTSLTIGAISFGEAAAFLLPSAPPCFSHGIFSFLLLPARTVAFLLAKTRRDPTKRSPPAVRSASQVSARRRSRDMQLASAASQATGVQNHLSGPSNAGPAGPAGDGRPCDRCHRRVLGTVWVPLRRHGEEHALLRRRRYVPRSGSFVRFLGSCSLGQIENFHQMVMSKPYA